MITNFLIGLGVGFVLAFLISLAATLIVMRPYRDKKIVECPICGRPDVKDEFRGCCGPSCAMVKGS